MRVVSRAPSSITGHLITSHILRPVPRKRSENEEMNTISFDLSTSLVSPSTFLYSPAMNMLAVIRDTECVNRAWKCKSHILNPENTSLRIG